ncbi:MAG: cation diffusion facilitator family transporter [Alphaproteobacteria bacterium]|nr:cation diffusion facilitator family transporter [Alphaproteobacteria bacterium]
MTSTTSDNLKALKKKAGFLSISLALFLSILKIIATIYTGSLAIYSSMIDSLSDVLASTVTFFAIRFSTRPASRDFRYGYGKAEAISSLFQSLFIAASGLYVLCDGIIRLRSPEALDDSFIGISIMIISLLLTLALVMFQNHVIKKTNSMALKADSAHYLVDLTTNASIILSLIAIKFYKIYWLDSVIAIVISLYLLHMAYGLLKEAILTLMDQELSDEIRQTVESLIKKQPFTRGIHDLRTRSLGEKFLFEFHLELDEDISLKQAHDYAHITEDEILKTYPNAQVIIHQEPFGAKEERLDDNLC